MEGPALLLAGKFMKKQLLILISLFVWALINAPASRGQTLNEVVSSSAQLAENEAAFDNRSQILEDYLAQFDSPLAEYAEEFVKAADTYDLDWRLLPAITGVESTYGKFIPQGSYNAYGWNNGAYYFQSWPDSIWHVTQALKEKYVDRGANTVDKIGRIYAPPSPFWAGKVKRLMDKIDSKPQFTLDL
jgi:hypothetical protein